jgi:hypothetical protein
MEGPSHNHEASGMIVINCTFCLGNADKSSYLLYRLTGKFKWLPGILAPKSLPQNKCVLLALGTLVQISTLVLVTT